MTYRISYHEVRRGGFEYEVNHNTVIVGIGRCDTEAEALTEAKELARWHSRRSAGSFEFDPSEVAAPAQST